MPTLDLRTRLCELLDIDYPVVQAGMAGGATTEDLVAAVSEAGGLGVLSGSRLEPDRLRAAIRGIRARTNRPFGVNFLLAPPETGRQDAEPVQAFFDRIRDELGLPDGDPSLDVPPSMLAEQLDVVFDEKVPVLSTGLGDPSTLVSLARSAGTRVMAMVTTVEEAARVSEGGADVVVAQGSEAGGHRSTFQLGPRGEAALVGTLALVPQVADAVGIPVVAAGGIMDGRGLVAALALGAEGVQMGTRFLTARESGAFPAYQHRLFSATEADTVITRVLTGRPTRTLRNRIVDEQEAADLEPLPWPLQGIAAQDIYLAAAARDEADFFPLQAGQGLRLLKRGQTAAEILEELLAEAAAAFVRLTGTRSGRGPRPGSGS